MYIALLRTYNNQLAIEVESLGKALHTLNNLMERHKGNVREALILEEEEYLDDQCPDFDSCKVIVSMGIIK